jgi:hypothetical protein
MSGEAVRREQLSPRASSVLWLAVASIWGTAAAVLVALDADAWYRAPITILFVVVVPGLAIVRLIGIPDILVRLMLGLALSLALGVLIPSTLLYLGAWSPLGALAILAGLAFAAALGEVARTLAADRRRDR